MKICRPYLVSLIFICFSLFSFGQQPDAAAFVKEGITLHDEGKYAEAIEKYKQALKLDPNNENAAYELAFSLYSSKNGKDAIPYLEKLAKSPSKMSAGACDLLGSIYDDDHKPDKAIAYYKKGLAADNTYQRLHYNLGIAYLRQNKYSEAEAYAVNALKLDPNHAGSHWLYAMINFNQNKKGPALIAFCNFLLLEPQTPRAQEAYPYLDKIFNAGITPGSGKTSYNLTLDANSLNKTGTGSIEMSLPLAQLADIELANKNIGTPVERLSNKLTSIFKIVGELKNNSANNAFFWTFYAPYFDSLSHSNNMPAFTRIISLTAYKDENTKWLQEHENAITELNNWATSNQHNIN